MGYKHCLMYKEPRLLKKKAKISQNLKVSGTSHTAGGQHKDTAGSLRAIWVSNWGHINTMTQ